MRKFSISDLIREVFEIDLQKRIFDKIQKNFLPNNNEHPAAALYRKLLSDRDNHVRISQFLLGSSNSEDSGSYVEIDGRLETAIKYGDKVFDLSQAHSLLKPVVEIFLNLPNKYKHSEDFIGNTNNFGYLNHWDSNEAANATLRMLALQATENIDEACKILKDSRILTKREKQEYLKVFDEMKNDILKAGVIADFERLGNKH